MGRLRVILPNEFSAVDVIVVKNPSTNQHRSALVLLREGLRLRQSTYAQRCCHYRIRLVSQSVENSLHTFDFVRLIKPFVNGTYCVIEGDDNLE